jgi:hypothetical protein
MNTFYGDDEDSDDGPMIDLNVVVATMRSARKGERMIVEPPWKIMLICKTLMLSVLGTWLPL